MAVLLKPLQFKIFPIVLKIVKRLEIELTTKSNDGCFQRFSKPVSLHLWNEMPLKAMPQSESFYEVLFSLPGAIQGFTF